MHNGKRANEFAPTKSAGGS